MLQGKLILLVAVLEKSALQKRVAGCVVISTVSSESSESPGFIEERSDLIGRLAADLNR